MKNKIFTETKPVVHEHEKKPWVFMPQSNVTRLIITPLTTEHINMKSLDIIITEWDKLTEEDHNGHSNSNLVRVLNWRKVTNRFIEDIWYDIGISYKLLCVTKQRYLDRKKAGSLQPS